MVTYMVILLSMINPYIFGVHDISGNTLLLIQTFFYTFMIPAFAVLMMKFLGFVDSFEMEDTKERIGPMMVVLTIYTWMAYNFYQSPDHPMALTIVMAGATLGVFLGFFINVFSKISLHAIGVGGLLGMVVIAKLFFSYDRFELFGLPVSMNALLMVTIIICGLVATSRLWLNAHRPLDVYGGFMVGFGGMFLALRLLYL